MHITCNLEAPIKLDFDLDDYARQKWQSLLARAVRLDALEIEVSPNPVNLLVITTSTSIRQIQMN